MRHVRISTILLIALFLTHTSSTIPLVRKNDSRCAPPPKSALCAKHGVDMVPLLYRGPFSAEKVEELCSGPTTLCPPDRAGKFKGREGIVIVPTKERAVTTPTNVFDRLILKCVSFEYLERKGGTEFH